MSDYMACADVMITKAGPGTIAEAAIRGLPTMLSSFLPGQEAGNVPFVTENGFGAYSDDPQQIATTVRSWIQDPEQLRQMSAAARAVSAPDATGQIATELLEMLEDGDYDTVCVQTTYEFFTEHLVFDVYYDLDNCETLLYHLLHDAA